MFLEKLNSGLYSAQSLMKRRRNGCKLWLGCEAEIYNHEVVIWVCGSEYLQFKQKSHFKEKNTFCNGVSNEKQWKTKLFVLFFSLHQPMLMRVIFYSLLHAHNRSALYRKKYCFSGGEKTQHFYNILILFNTLIGLDSVKTFSCISCINSIIMWKAVKQWGQPVGSAGV